MIDIKQFEQLQKKSKNSFAEHRQVLKKVMAGQIVLCEVCRQPLTLLTPESEKNSPSNISGIRCSKGCTEIQLDFV